MRESTVTWNVLGDWEGKVDEKDKLVCLNFKVPLQIRKRFKIHAASQNMTMTDLLLKLLNDSMTADAVRMQSPPTESEIKK